MEYRAEKRRFTSLLLLGDALAAGLSYSLFFIYRQRVVEGLVSPTPFWQNPSFQVGIVVIPLLWMVFYALWGVYRKALRFSFWMWTGMTLVQTVVGSIFFFLLLFLDDRVPGYTSYYTNLAVFALLHFVLTLLWRLLWLAMRKRRQLQGGLQRRTLLIGKAEDVELFLTEHETYANRYYREIIGYVGMNDKEEGAIELAELAGFPELPKVLQREVPDEMVCVSTAVTHEEISRMLGAMGAIPCKLYLLPEMHDILAGMVRMDELDDSPLVLLNTTVMPTWQCWVKRFIDIVFSAVALLLLSPLLLFVALRVRRSSEGPVFYQQERVGQFGKSFKIVKFRSMYVDAEQHGPALAQENDKRITPWGQVMRKWRIDELPQFWNVLKGDMSLVGPRPERPYFIDKMAEHAPYCRYLHRVRPGITSLGMVRFGYAADVESMLKRLTYDMIYLRNAGLLMDFKIIMYTIKTLFQGKGR